MDAEDIIQSLKNKQFQPIYFMHGDESYFMDRVANYAADHLLTEEEKAFNRNILYGREVGPGNNLVSLLKGIPMMGDKQVVIIKEAQDFKEFDKLTSYFTSPSKSTLLFICYKGSPDKRKKDYKTWAANSVMVEFKKLYDNKIPAWVTAFLKNHKYQIQPAAAQLIADSIGNDLSTIAGELQKLMISVPATQTIDVNHVDRYIGINKDFNVFELTNALGKRDALKCFTIGEYFAGNNRKFPFIMTLAQLSSFYVKLLQFHLLADKSGPSVARALGINPFFVGDYEKSAKMFGVDQTVNAVHLCAEYDLKSKGIEYSSADDGEMLKELLGKLLTL